MVRLHRNIAVFKHIMTVFPFQKPYEKTELFLRRHWLILFFIYLGFGLMALAGLAGFYFSKNLLILGENGLALARFLLIIYFLIIWEGLFKALADFFLDVWIVTDHRILEIHQLGLFKRDVSELRLSKIEDVSVKVKGILPTFFNYGEVMIQTAGAIPEFKFEQVSRPQQVKDEILRLHDEFVKQHPGETEVHESR